MEYGSPEYLLLLFLIPLLIIFFFITGKLRDRALAVFGNLDLMKRLIKNVSRKRRILKKTLLLITLTLMIIALARPKFGTRMREVHRKGVDIMIVLDASLSMMAEDVKPNRLEVAKREIADFITQLKGDRVGLLCFAGVPFVQCPLTLDYSAAALFLDSISPDLIPAQGTAIGNAIRTAVDAFHSKELKYKVIILITDGEDHRTKPLEAAEYAKKNGVVIYTIGIGTREGNPIPIKDKNGVVVDRKKSSNGDVVISKLDETTLLKIAAKTGGKYHRVVNGQLALPLIYKQINKMEKRELSSKLQTYHEDRFQIFLFLAVVILALESIISDRRKVKVEWKGRFH